MDKCPDCGEETGLLWWGRCFTCGMRYMAKQGHKWAEEELKKAELRKKETTEVPSGASPVYDERGMPHKAKKETTKNEH